MVGFCLFLQSHTIYIYIRTFLQLYLYLAGTKRSWGRQLRCEDYRRSPLKTLATESCIPREETCPRFPELFAADGTAVNHCGIHFAADACPSRAVGQRAMKREDMKYGRLRVALAGVAKPWLIYQTSLLCARIYGYDELLITSFIPVRHNFRVSVTDRNRACARTNAHAHKHRRHFGLPWTFLKS